MQASIDVAAEAAASASAILDAWKRTSAGDEAFSAVVVEAARLAAKGREPNSIIETCAFGIESATSELGAISVPSAEGLRLAIFGAMARWYLDETEFWRIGRETLSFARARLASLAVCAATAEWRRWYERAAADVISAGDRLKLLLDAARTDLQNVHAWLDYVHDIQEGVSKFVFATLRTIDNPGGDLRTELVKGGSNLAEWIDSRGLSSSAPFLTPSRHALAHNDWHLEGETIVLQVLRSAAPVRLSAEELVDHVLAVVESALGCFVGLLVAVYEAGIDPPETEHLVPIDWSEYVSAILAAGGWLHAKTDLNDGTVTITGSVYRRATLTEVLAVHSYLPRAVERLHLDIMSPTGRHVVTVRLDLVRRYADAVGTARDAYFCAVLSTGTKDSAPIVDEAQHRKYMSVLALQCASEERDHKSASSGLKAIRDAAGEIGDTELGQAIRRLQSWRSMKLNGFDEPVSQVQDILDWAATSTTRFDPTL